MALSFMARASFAPRLCALSLAALGCIASTATAQTAPFSLPPITTQPSSEHYPGKVIFMQLITPDLANSKNFYGQLFGWTFSDVAVGPNRYAEVYSNGWPVGGIFEKRYEADQRRQPAWIPFLSSTDVDATEALALKNGGSVMVHSRRVPGRGQEAIVEDPQGAVFGILDSASGDPPEAMAEPGEWIWSSLLTADPEKDAAFYQNLFNYEVYDLPSDRFGAHLILAADNYSRASANTLPGRPGYERPRWLGFVRVDDAEASARRAIQLGGSVLIAPHADRHGGRVAVLADPAGAAFGVMEWSAAQASAAGVPQ